MKKFILSMFVMVSFGFYVIRQNVGNSTNNFTTPAPIVATNATKKISKTRIYNDGEYIGNSIVAYYGYIQVKAIITNGELANVIFLDYPQDRRTSIQISNYAMPILKSEAIRTQSSNVNTVSGATDSSGAFRESLAGALAQAKV